MPTRHLTLTNPTHITVKSDQAVVKIEVPKGETHYHLDLGTPLPEQQFIFHIQQPGSNLLLTGLVKATGESAPRLLTQVVHHAPHTKAETIIRTLAEGSAQPQYEGTIIIKPAAQETESYLNHHSLLLGPEAKSWTRPALEIEADQVKCSHAATLHNLTEQDLFYLRSRGLEKEAAKELLIQAFVADVA